MKQRTGDQNHGTQSNQNPCGVVPPIHRRTSALEFGSTTTRWLSPSLSRFEHQGYTKVRDRDVKPNFLESTTTSCGIIHHASSKNSSRHLSAARPEANELYPPRFFVNLRCRLLSLLKIHRPDCEVCNAREEYGVEMRKRLEELGWGTQSHSSKELMGVFDSEPREVVSTPVSFEAQKRKKTA
jgi:hypothetical protein